MPVARVVRGVEVDEREHAMSRPRRRLRIVVLLLLVPLLALPLAAVVVQIASDSQRMMAKAESEPERIDPVVMLEGTALANQLHAELENTDASVARFVAATAPDKLAGIAPSTKACGNELAEVGLVVPRSDKDTVSYAVRTSAHGEQVDPGTIAGVAVDAKRAIDAFREQPTSWRLLAMRQVAMQLHTIVFVVGVRTPAVVQIDPRTGVATSFEPGSVRGTGYVYSAREHRVRCAGAIEATNGETIRYNYRLSGFIGESTTSAERALADDLDDQMLVAIEQSMRRVAF